MRRKIQFLKFTDLSLGDQPYRLPPISLLTKSSVSRLKSEITSFWVWSRKHNPPLLPPFKKKQDYSSYLTNYWTLLPILLNALSFTCVWFPGCPSCSATRGVGRTPCTSATPCPCLWTHTRGTAPLNECPNKGVVPRQLLFHRANWY